MVVLTVAHKAVLAVVLVPVALVVSVAALRVVQVVRVVVPAVAEDDPPVPLKGRLRSEKSSVLQSVL